MNLPEALRGMDIYLLDQLLRGHVPERAVVLDAGCGRGRNLRFFVEQGHDVHAVDSEAEAIASLRASALDWGGKDLDRRLHVEAIETLSLPANHFDLVICNAVLHFARDESHFDAMLRSLHRVTRPGGLCFTRLASTIGIETAVTPLPAPAAPRWYRLPDGSDRFLVDVDFLLERNRRLRLELVDPIKTVQVQGLRSMTNWVWRKGRSPDAGSTAS